MNINVPLQFIAEPNKYPDYLFPYRAKIIPEAVDNKQAFISALNKYTALASGSNYIFEETVYDANGFYNYSTEKTAAKYRNFSIAIDKTTSIAEEQSSTSNEFLNADGFLLFTYDNEDSNIVANMDAILSNPVNKFEVYTKNSENYIQILTTQNLIDPFISAFFLLLIPITETFQFGVNQIIYNTNGIPKSIKNTSGIEVIDSHFIQIDNLLETYQYNSNVDTNGKPFASDSYKIYLIAQDEMMGIWKNDQASNTTRYILDYYSEFIDKDGLIARIYPQISSLEKIIAKPTIVDSSSSLENILKTSGDRYFHFTLNKTILIENIFDTSINTTSVFPNYTLSRRNVIYKPSLDTNLSTTKDDIVVSSANNGIYYKLSLQNRNLLSSISDTPLTVPSSKRAYALNGNKIFCRGLKQNEGPFSSSIPQRIDPVFAEGITNNCFQVSNNSTDSFFGKDKQEIFDISIIRLDDLSGDLLNDIKQQNTKLQDIYSIAVNASTANTEANSQLLFNNFIVDGNCSSAFNVINVTPSDNGSSFEIDSKNTIITFETSPEQQTVYSLDGNLINNKFGLSNINNLYYAGIPVLDSLGLLNFNIILPNSPASTFYNNIKVYCYNGEDLINDTNIEIDKNTNIIKVTLKNLKPQNYYTYTNSYTAGTSIRNDTPFSRLSFWKFSDAKNLAFAHLSAKNALGAMPKYNFHIQAIELSIVVTF